ncbi:MAG: hypothetical protein V5A28_08995 [Haloarculaceae archaeon]
MASSGDDADDGNGDDRAWWQRSDPDPPSVGPDVPEVDVPEVDVPSPDDATGGADVDVDTAKGFWRLVLVFDVALLALALGPMFVYFRGDLRRGGMLFAFGALAFLYGVARYREFRAEDETRDNQADTSEDGGEIDEA